MVRAGTVIARIPRRAAILSWVARPASPSEASVPAPPPSMATNTRPSQPRRRSTWRQSSSIHTATLKPNVAGTACWPWVRPGSKSSLVRSAYLEELAGLRDVLGRGAPVHVAAGITLADAIQRPDQRHQRMAGLRQAGAHGREVQILEMRLADDLASGAFGDNAQLGLRLRQGRLHVEPRLEARGFGEQ